MSIDSRFPSQRARCILVSIIIFQLLPICRANADWVNDLSKDPLVASCPSDSTLEAYNRPGG